MPDTFLQRFPDLTAVLQMRGDVEVGINDLLSTFGSIGSDNPASPLAGVAGTLTRLQSKLNINTEGLSAGLPTSITTIENALPPDTLEYVRSIESAYTSAQDFLKNSPLASQVPQGSTLQDTALAVIDEVLHLFDSRLAGLTNGMLDPQTLDRVRDSITAIEEFRTDFPAHQADFLPFVTNNLVGVAPDLLRAPLLHVQDAYSVLAGIEPDALATALDPARQAIAEAFDNLTSAIHSIDPAAAAGYAEVESRLGELEQAINALSGVLTPLYQQTLGLVQNQSWDAIFSTYTTLLGAIQLDRIPSIDDMIEGIASALDDILARVFMTFGVDDLSARIDALSKTIHDSFAGSPLGQIRQVLRDFLGEIRQAIESIPTEEVQAAIISMLARVKQELDDLGITGISSGIENAFADIDTFVTTNINADLTNQVHGAMEQLLGNVQNLPVDDLISLLSGVVDQLDGLIKEVADALDARMADLTQFVSQLDQLSFKPLSDEVIKEIDDLKARLQAINPNALSDPEKLAIKAALAVLEAIDLDKQVIEGLKAGYNDAETEIKALLSDLTALLQRLRDKLNDFSPNTVLEPLNDSLDQVSKLVDQLNGKVLLNPLYSAVDRLVSGLEALSPGRVLDPLQAPYASMMGVVQQLDPDRLVAPLNDLYAEIDKLIGFVDVTPVLDELDRRQKELFATARGAVLDALDGLNLPEPLNTFFAQLRPVLTGMTDAVFNDPDTELKRINVDLISQVSLGSLFEPLDAAFDPLITMVESVPVDALTESMNDIREAIGVGLDELEPRAIVNRFRSALGQLTEIDPIILLGVPMALPELKLSFSAQVEAAPPERQGDVASVSARFDAVFALVDPEVSQSLTNQLAHAYEELVNTLRSKINSLDTSGAGEAYAALRDNLYRLVPDFLRQPTPLERSDIIQGLHAMRPSAKAARVEQVLDRFLQRMKPLEEALTPAINDFFDSIRQVVMLINPLALKDAVEDIYTAIHEKVRVLDPSLLAATIREDFFDPLADPLQAIDPARIKARIDQAFSKALDAVSTTVKAILDDIVSVINEQLKPLRAQIQALVKKIEDAVKSLLDKVKGIIDRVERLVFVDLLARLNQVIDNLGLSFDKELDRVDSAFKDMIAAIPL